MSSDYTPPQGGSGSGGIPQGGPLTSDLDAGNHEIFNAADFVDSNSNSFESLFNGTGGSVVFSTRAQEDASGNDIQGSYALQSGNYGELTVGFAGSASSADFATYATNDASGNNIQSTYVANGSTPSFNGLSSSGNFDLTSAILNGIDSFAINMATDSITLGDNSTAIDFSSQASLKSTLGPIVNPVYFQRLTADSAGVTGMTPAAPSTGGISVTLPAGTYKFDAGLIVGTASTTSGVQLQMNSASGDNFTYACIFGPSNTSPNWFGGNVAGVGNYAVLVADAPTTDSQCHSTGVLVVATSGTYIAVLAQRTAVDLSHPIFLKAGSWVRFEKQ